MTTVAALSVTRAREAVIRASKRSVLAREAAAKAGHSPPYSFWRWLDAEYRMVKAVDRLTRAETRAVTREKRKPRRRRG